MKKTFIRWMMLTIAVEITTLIVPGMSCASWKSLLIASFVLGTLNTFVKPILTIISLPFIFLSLGLFVVLINTLLLQFTGYLVSGFYVGSFWSALAGAVLISVINMTLSREKRPSKKVFFRWEGASNYRKAPPAGKGPIIDIEGESV